MSPLPPLKATLIWGHLAEQWHFKGQGDILGLWAHLHHKVKMWMCYFSEGLWPLFAFMSLGFFVYESFGVFLPLVEWRGRKGLLQISSHVYK